MLPRSLVTGSIHLNGVPALGLIFSFSVLYILSLDRVSIFLKTCPSHWSVRCISSLSIDASLALFWMFLILIWTHLVTLGYHGMRYSTLYGMFSTCSSPFQRWSLSLLHTVAQTWWEFETPSSLSLYSNMHSGTPSFAFVWSFFKYGLLGRWRSQPIRLVVHTNGTSSHSTASTFDFSALIAIPYFLHTMSTASC